MTDVTDETPSPPVRTLDELLGAVAAGDRRAFELLYDRVAPLVYSIVLRIVRDPARSEEVAQEVLVELWRTAPRYDAALGSARAWVAMIAHRRAVDLVRSEQSARDRAAAFGRREAAGGEALDVVALEALDRDEQAQVRSALDGLTATQREAIVLAYYGGLTMREVADHLEAPIGTVKSRVRDGLIKMRTLLELDDG